MTSTNDIIIFDFGEDVIKLYYKDDSRQFLEFFSEPTFTNEKRRYLETSKKIKSFLRDNNIQTQNAAVCISEKNVFIKRTQIKTEKYENFDTLVQNYVNNNFPFNMQEISIDYLITKEESTPDGTYIDVTISAVANYIIEKHSSFIEDLGLTPSIISLAQLCVIRAFNQLAPVSDGCTLCIDLGSTKTELIFTKKGELSFYRSLATGGEALSKEIAEYFQASPEELQQMIGRLDLDSISQETVYKIGKKDPAEVIEHILETLIIDIKRTIGYYINNEQGNNIEKIILFGGNSNIKNISKFFTKTIGVKTTVFPYDPGWLEEGGVNAALFENNLEKYFSSVNIIGFKRLIDEGNFINLAKKAPEQRESDTESKLKSFYKSMTKDKSENVFLTNLYNLFLKLAILFKPINKININRTEIFNSKNNYSLIGIGGFIIIVVYYLFIRVNIMILDNRIEKDQKAIAVLNKQTEELDNYRTRIAQINDEHNSFSSALSKNIFNEFLDYFIRYKSNNQIDFIRIDLSKEKNEIHIIGDSKDGNIIAVFIKELQANANVKNADIVYITQKDNSFEFELLIQLK